MAPITTPSTNELVGGRTAITTEATARLQRLCRAFAAGLAPASIEAVGCLGFRPWV